VVRDQVLDKLSFGFDDLGPQEVKNIARPFHRHWRQSARSRKIQALGLSRSRPRGDGVRRDL